MRAAALALTAGVGLAVALLPHPAVTDLPVHVVRFTLMADLLDGAARNPFYMHDVRWLPNTLLDIVFAGIRVRVVNTRHGQRCGRCLSGSTGLP